MSKSFPILLFGLLSGCCWLFGGLDGLDVERSLIAGDTEVRTMSKIERGGVIGSVSTYAVDIEGSLRLLEGKGVSNDLSVLTSLVDSNTKSRRAVVVDRFWCTFGLDVFYLLFDKGGRLIKWKRVHFN